MNRFLNTKSDNLQPVRKTHVPTPSIYGLQAIKVGVSVRGTGGQGLDSVAAVACTSDFMQMCGKTQALADLVSSQKASASSEVGPTF